MQKNYTKEDICKAIGCKKADSCDNLLKSPDGSFLSRKIDLYLGGGYALSIECSKYEPKEK